MPLGVTARALKKILKMTLKTNLKTNLKIIPKMMPSTRYTVLISIRWCVFISLFLY